MAERAKSVTDDSSWRSANDFVQLTRAGFGDQTKAALGQGLTKREGQRVGVDDDVQDPGPSEVRAEIRDWRRGRAELKWGEVLSDGYIALFCVVMIGAMGGNVVLTLRRLADAGARCLVHLADGTRHEAYVDRVGADFLEGRATSGEVFLVPYAGLVAVQSRED